MGVAVPVTAFIVKFKGAISCYFAPFYKTKKPLK